MGHYSSQTLINARDQNGATNRVTSEAINEVRPAALGLIQPLSGNQKQETRTDVAPSDTRLRWPGRGRYLSQTRMNAGGQNGATIRVTSQAIIEVKPAALGQIWHLPGNHK